MPCPELESALEQLPGTGYDKYPISARTGGPPQGYNCIAFAAGRTDRWWWPSPKRYLYDWPSHLPREAEGAESKENFIRAFESLGYTRCRNGKPQKGIEKVAIFLLNGIPKHGARQLESGRWINKCGGLEDIQHEMLSVVEGKLYGKAAIFLHRRRDGKPFFLDRVRSFIKGLLPKISP